MLLLLRDVLNPSVRVYLNPQTDLSELPLKSYYRYLLSAALGLVCTGLLDLRRPKKRPCATHQPQCFSVVRQAAGCLHNLTEVCLPCSCRLVCAGVSLQSN